jgi:hypothetical protein
MKNTFMLFDKRFDIDQPYIRLLIIVFISAVFAKGPVLFRGYAVDDYVLMTGINSRDLGVYFSQGRYIAAAIAWVVNSIGTNMGDLYFSLGIVTLFLQAAFVVSILRFIGMEHLPTAGLVGAIMVAHPYLTEIFTFRMTLPYYSFALILSIIALEMVIRSPATWGARAFALLATLAMLFTYQVFLNYFAVAIIFAFIFGQILHNTGKALTNNNVYRKRALLLTIISTISVIAFGLITRLVRSVGFAYLQEGRTNVIAFNKIPERIEQISSSLVKIYWSAEPVFPRRLKTLVALMLLISVVIVFWHVFREKGKGNYRSNIVLTFIAFLLLIPLSLGVIIPLENWWPVPRVIAHVSIIIGLLFLLADACMPDPGSPFLKSTIIVFRTIVLVAFIFLSNQILADQQRINRWDWMMANRIISRLEMHPNFSNVQFVHINGGSWGFPDNLRTVQGNINVSAFCEAWSKVPLLSEVSGYRFEAAIGPKAAIGEIYCENRPPWPHAESVTVDNDLAIICLKK